MERRRTSRRSSSRLRSEVVDDLRLHPNRLPVGRRARTELEALEHLLRDACCIRRRASCVNLKSTTFPVSSTSYSATRWKPRTLSGIGSGGMNSSSASADSSPAPPPVPGPMPEPRPVPMPEPTPPPDPGPLPVVRRGPCHHRCRASARSPRPWDARSWPRTFASGIGLRRLHDLRRRNHGLRLRLRTTGGGTTGCDRAAARRRRRDLHVLSRARYAAGAAVPAAAAAGRSRSARSLRHLDDDAGVAAKSKSRRQQHR